MAFLVIKTANGNILLNKFVDPNTISLFNIVQMGYKDEVLDIAASEIASASIDYSDVTTAGEHLLRLNNFGGPCERQSGL